MDPRYYGNWSHMGAFQTNPAGFQQPPHGAYDTSAQAPQAFMTNAPAAPFQPPAQSLKVQLTGRERGIYTNYMSKVDPDNKNKIEGSHAVEFFKKSGLPVQTLKEIWNISTPGGESYLDRDRFFVALRLVALAQEGKEVSVQAILRNEPAALPKFQIAAPPKDIWKVEHEEQSEYTHSFMQAGGGKGFLDRTEAMNAFIASNLPKQYLSKVWNLTDPQGTGMFSVNQYIVAMHLITRVQRHKEPVPAELPPALSAVLTQSIQPAAQASSSLDRQMSSRSNAEDDAFAGLVNIPTGPSMVAHPSASQSSASLSGLSVASMATQPSASLSMAAQPSFSSHSVNSQPAMSSQPSISSQLSMSSQPSMIPQPPQPASSLQQPSISSMGTSPAMGDSLLGDSLLSMQQPSQSAPVNSPPKQPAMSAAPKLEKPASSAAEDVFGAISEEFNLAPQRQSSMLKSSPPRAPATDIVVEPKVPDEVDHEIQAVLLQWTEIRSMLSLEWERNQLLVSKLQEVSNESLDSTFNAFLAFASSE